MENEQLERGKKVLRDYGLLADVPLLETPPQIDGRLDDGEWEHAFSFDAFYQAGLSRSAAFLSDVRTRGYLAYTRDALYLAARCYDARPDSLVVESHEPDNNISHQDLVQLYLYVDFEPNSFVYISINSVGAVTDAWNKGKNSNDRDVTWETETEGAAYVGEDFWSVECKLGLGTAEFPRPEPGAMWRFNMQRNFRGRQFSQWVRVYPDRPYPDCFGFLVFE